MTDTIEGINKKILDKLEKASETCAVLKPIIVRLRAACCVLTNTAGKKYEECIRRLDCTGINLILDSCKETEREYRMSVVAILVKYYSEDSADSSSYLQSSNDLTIAFCRIVSSEGVIGKVGDLLAQVRSAINVLCGVLACTVLPAVQTKPLVAQLNAMRQDVESTLNIGIALCVEKCEQLMCERCGERMFLVPELSELHCVCGAITTIVGTVFNEVSTQDGSKPAHCGYDTSRHYKFWIERLQALESTLIEEKYLRALEYIIVRDGYDRRALTCEDIRYMLKDPKVSGAHLNDHAPLFVKMFGGTAPPRLDFAESRTLSVRFNTIMRLYGKCVEGGNKPYYPYFIYKIIEHEFKDKPDKLRLLDYIHLQSPDTVIKLDLVYKQICAIASPADGLVYKPTNPRYDRGARK